MLYHFKTNEFNVLLTLYLNSGERLAITLRYYATGDINAMMISRQ